MNGLLILMVLLVAGNIAWGIHRGLLRVVYSVISWLLVLIFVTFATPYVTNFLTDHTLIDEHIKESMEEKLHNSVIGEEAVEETRQTQNDSSKDTLEDLSGKLPQVVADRLLNSGNIVDGMLEESGAYEAIATKLTDMAMRTLSCIVVLVISVIVFKILAVALDLVAKLPVIGDVNHFLGGIAGFIKGILLVWVVFSFVAMGSATETGAMLVRQIYDSPLLVWFYENNFVLTIFMYYF